MFDYGTSAMQTGTARPRGRWVAPACVLLYVLLALTAPPVYGQAARIDGRVVTCYGGAPAAFAGVELAEDGATVDVAAADTAGVFQFDWLGTGTYALTAYRAGQSADTTLAVAAGVNARVILCLGPDVPADTLRYSAHRARADLAAGRVEVLVFEPPPLGAAPLSGITSRFGFVYRRLGGRLTEALRQDAAAYNAVVHAHLAARHGPDWQARVRAELEAALAGRRAPGDPEALVAGAAPTGQHLLPRFSAGLGGGGFFPLIENFARDHYHEPVFSVELSAKLLALGASTALYGVGQAARFMALRKGKELIRWEGLHLHAGARLVYHEAALSHTALWLGGGLTRFNMARRRYRDVQEYYVENNRVRIRLREEVDSTPYDATGAYLEVGQQALYKPGRLSYMPGLFWTLRHDFVRRGSENIGGWGVTLGASLSM